MIIREGKKEDLSEILKLIRELALFEKAPQEVINTVEMMEEDGFGPRPVFGSFVAEKNNTIVGIAIYFWRYSTWKGKRIYLEDIIVTASERGKGIGKLLFERIMEKALEENCTGMAWQVLDWNHPAIEFYKKFGAKLDSEWINCSLEREEIRRIVKK